MLLGLLLGAAAMRMFIERGFEATTMEKILNEVGISWRSLFRYREAVAVAGTPRTEYSEAPAP
jgi:Bacterial regulatory proteins, tetR family